MRWPIALLVVLFGFAPSARAYVDCALSLGRIVGDASSIFVVRVDKVSAEKQAILFKRVAQIKGMETSDDVKQLVQHGFHPREPRLVMDMAEPGATAVCFVCGRSMLVCLGTYWYECSLREAPWWDMTCGRPDLALAYNGSPHRLADAVKDIVAGKEVVVPVVQYDAGGEYRQLTDFQNTLRGHRCPVVRVKASLKLDGFVSELSRQPGYVVGRGAVSEEEAARIEPKFRDTPEREQMDMVQELAFVDGKTMPSCWSNWLEEIVEQTKDPLLRIRAAAVLLRWEAETPAVRNSAQWSAVRDRGYKMLRYLEFSLSREARNEVDIYAALDAFSDLGSELELFLQSSEAARMAELPRVPRVDVVGTIALSLACNNPRVRWRAAEALGRIGAAASPAVPDLQKLLTDPSIRLAAADALGWIGKNADAAADDLVKLTSDPDSEMRRVAAWSLIRIGKGTKAAVPVLTEDLKQSDWRLRRDSAGFLWQLGDTARPALPALTEAMHDGHAHVRWAASGAVVGLLGPAAKDALPPLLSALRDKDNVLTRRYAPALLVQLGATARPALPALVEALNDPDADVRRCAAMALAVLEPTGRDRVALVIDALAKSELPYVRRQAAMTLGQLGPAAKTAEQALYASVRDHDDSVREAALWALGRVGGKR
jgi:HEAT repeat protein